MSEAETWARVVILLLVILYSIIVFFMTVKYVVRNYFVNDRSRMPSWDPVGNGSEFNYRRQRGFYTEDDLPQFEAALKYPIPNPKVIIEIEQPPPSYEDYIHGLYQNKLTPTHHASRSTNYLEIDEAKNHM